MLIDIFLSTGYTFINPLGLISRYLIDIIIIGLFVRWCWKKKRRRKKYLNRKNLKRLAIALVIIYIIIPQGLGRVYPRAKYFPQLIEAYKLKLYYSFFSLIPGVKSSRPQIYRYISSASRKYKVERHFIEAIIDVESNWRQSCISSTGACGLMQLMPSTFYSVHWGNPFIAKNNIEAGAKYIKRLQRILKTNDKRTIAQAYNSGPGRALKYRGRAIPIKETQNYVRKVMYHFNRRKKRNRS